VVCLLLKFWKYLLNKNISKNVCILHPNFIKMINLRLYILAILGFSLLFSCKKNDNDAPIPPRPYNEQYATESLEIEEYLATHYVSGNGLQAKINKIPEDGTQTPISQLSSDVLKEILVNKHDIQYKIYYILLEPGINQRPSHVDSVFVSFKGWVLDGTQFSNSPNPIWLYHEGVDVDGLTYFFSELKTGVYNQTSNLFENSGNGIVIIPSGLGFYNSTQTNVPAYSTLVFNLTLNTLKYRDHDRDGIQSRFESRYFSENSEDTNHNRDPRNYDSDNDRIPNYLDIDDDNDGILTRKEIEKNQDGELYLFDEIPSCNQIKVHLDPACEGPIF